MLESASPAKTKLVVLWLEYTGLWSILFFVFQCFGGFGFDCDCDCGRLNKVMNSRLKGPNAEVAIVTFIVIVIRNMIFSNRLP